MHHSKPIRTHARSTSISDTLTHPLPRRSSISSPADPMAPISPRSSNYERLEGGMGPSRLPGVKRFAWKRLAIAAAVIIGLVFLFSPRESLVSEWNTLQTAPPPASPPKFEHAHDTPSVPNSNANANANPGSSPAKPQDHSLDIPLPTSFENDPDPSKTTLCTRPHSPDAPLVQYALMIDAGSTGSRIHAYKFNNCFSSPTYEYETFVMTQPGLSSFAKRPQEAARSLDVLMDKAMEVVPEKLRKCTPVAVKATAGLRLLPKEEADAILEAVEGRLKSAYPFQMHGGVEIMDGKDEGVYAWITVNYLLKTISGSSSDAGQSKTSYAVLDLGGASTQIVFEPTFADDSTHMVEGEHKYDLLFGGKKHVLYQHSYLGYGLMRARMSVHKLVDFMASIRTSPSSSAVANPCLAKGTKRVVEVADERSDTKRNVTMVGEDVGSFEACDRVVQLVMAKDSICEVKPCSFNGVYQPSLLDTFPSGKILLLSYFYDRLSPLLPPDSHITIATIAEVATDVCRGHSAWLTRWGKDEKVMEELEGRPEWCLDLTFMHGLLRLGYEFGEARDVEIGKRIGGTELGWALGATIQMIVGGELSCRV